GDSVNPRRAHPERGGSRYGGDQRCIAPTDPRHLRDRGARAQRLKGIADPVPLYRVVQPSGVRSRLDLAAGKLTPLVGRQSELGMLLDAWERVLDGIGQTMLVHGEPGWASRA